MIEIRLLEQDKEKNKVSFVLMNSTPSFANVIRRAIIEEVPVMAIEDVEFRKNNSILYDEIIAHRLGLLPLTTDLKSYNLSSECKCKGKGCARCQLKLTLKAKVEIQDKKLIITEIPYMVNKTSLIESIADLVRDKRVEGIRNIQDESDRK